MEEPPSVASAIVIPESSDLPQPDSLSSPKTDGGPSLKRRQSDVSDADSKRRRLSYDEPEKPAEKTASPPVDTERRKSRQVEERKRGQRLFGALLGTLSQGGGGGGAAKRRAEIEKRQHEKLRLQDQEDESRRKERLENLRAVRKKEQVKYEEKTMRMRHKNMLHFANFLRTTTEPRIYYKPWELTTAQEDIIADQIADTKERIEEELEAFARRKERAQREYTPKLGLSETGPTSGISKPDEEMPTSETLPSEPPAAEASEPMEQDSADADTNEVPLADTDTPVQTQTSDSPATAMNEPVVEETMADADDDQGETVVEAEEDTVIY